MPSQLLRRTAIRRGRRPIAALSITAAALLTTAACSAPAEEDTGGQAGAAEAGKSSRAKKAGIGAEVRDGKFAFTITKVKAHVKNVEKDGIADKPQGEFVLVYVTVKNIGKEAQLFSDDEQKAVDRKGREYSPSSEASLILNGDNDAYLAEINPGNSVKGVLAYDVPLNTDLVTLELHDSVFSDGVKVSLAQQAAPASG